MPRSLILILTILLGIQLSGHAQQKRALVICIGEQQDKSWGKISAANDLEYVKALLDYCRYDEVRTLVGKAATKSAIVDAFVGLKMRCRPGDLVYIHFSGHGQRMTDLGGDEASRVRNDLYDESWIPYDAYMRFCSHDNGSRHFSDDEAAVLLSEIKKKIGPEGEILVVVDACHSGGSTRDGKTADELDGCPTRGAETYFIIPESENNPAEIATIEEKWLTLSACTDYQSNYECTSPQVGRLTYALYKLRWFLGYMSNERFMKVLEAKINSYEPLLDPEQNPTLSEYNCDIRRFFQR